MNAGIPMVSQAVIVTWIGSSGNIIELIPDALLVTESA
jgi:hypothetical protein